jgi:hypothetical protein
MSQSGSGKLDLVLEGVELLFQQIGGSASIVSKVPKGDNLLLGPQTFIVKTLIIQNAHSRYFYTQTERRGNRQAARETERECVRECECCGKTDIGICHKTGRWKNPLTSFWDKPRRINFSWETILMEE